MRDSSRPATVLASKLDRRVFRDSIANAVGMADAFPFDDLNRPFGNSRTVEPFDANRYHIYHSESESSLESTSSIGWMRKIETQGVSAVNGWCYSMGK
jgi:hypothetical protein